MALLPLAALSADELIKWALVFFLFVLPGIKSLLSGSREAQEKRRKAPADEGPDRDFADAEVSGEEVWKRLLRGQPVEVPERAAPARRPPAPRKRPVPAPSLAPSSSFPENASGSPPEPPGALDVMGRVRGGGAGAAGAADPPSGASIGSFRSSMESGGRDGGELGGSFAALSVRTAAAEPWAARSSRVRREDWRRAIVLREVLGPPLALRSADSDLASLR